MSANSIYDYIIIGAGATGCVLANRLSADAHTRVLLLEAGVIDENPAIADPTGLVSMWGSDLDWKLTTEAQPGLNGRNVLINQGKVIGGSSSIHAMMYVRGNRRNFDYWSYLGNDGWSYQEVLPYFKKSEDFEGGASEYHGAGGPLFVRQNPDPSVISPEFQNGAVELGFEGPGWDYNGKQQEDGAGPLQFNITPQFKRQSAAAAFLTPVLDRPNLTVKTSSPALQIDLESHRACGVEYISSNQRVHARADKEVILSAGAFLSPGLLMHSGIGPAEHLRSLGISVVADLPGVGKNLQDHMQLPVIFSSKVNRKETALLTGNVLFTRSRQDMDHSAAPDLQILFNPSIPKPLSAAIPVPRPACVFIVILTQPYSTGSVSISSDNPLDPPVIDPNYLVVDTDVKVMEVGIDLARQIAATRSFSDLNKSELAPGPGSDLEGYIRASASTIWHPAGTCRMGRDAMAVVDPQLRVHGVEGLRVADASVMPAVPSGNTFAGCVMIGEKLADLILNNHK